MVMWSLSCCGQHSHMYDALWNIHSQCWVPDEKRYLGFNKHHSQAVLHPVRRCSYWKDGVHGGVLSLEEAAARPPIQLMISLLTSWKPFSHQRNIMAQHPNSAELHLHWTLLCVFSKYHCCHSGKGVVEKNKKKTIIWLPSFVMLPILLCDLLFWASTEA